MALIAVDQHTVRGYGAGRDTGPGRRDWLGQNHYLSPYSESLAQGP